MKPIPKIFSFSLIACFLVLISACAKPPEGMVLVQGGKFLMGTDEKDTKDKAAEYGIIKPWFKDQHPAHQIDIPTFYIDRYEVTNAQYREFVQKTGRRSPPDWTGGGYPKGKENHPVVHITWTDANAYCLSAGKRLPTEAEWEKAARGTDGRKYSWGNEFDEQRANINNQVGQSTPVGQFENGKSPYGAYDMIGNVWEWTSDWYKPYPGNTYEDDKFGEKVRVLRGNSWAGVGHFPPEAEREIKEHYSLTTFRMFMGPTGYVNDVGVRCAKSKE